MTITTQPPARAIKSLAGEADALLSTLGVKRGRYTGGKLIARSPITGEITGHVNEIGAADAHAAIDKAHAAFLEWRLVPAPKRGELVRLLGEELRANKQALGRLVSIEAGKIASEGLGEVQEMIDICDFAVGLSRQLYGLTIATERSEHRMMESWHPLGVTGIISAFNFPVAVWSWNAALALVCGNSIVWKPSEKTPLTALATEALFDRALERFRAEGGKAPDALVHRALRRPRHRRSPRRSRQGPAGVGDRLDGDGARRRTAPGKALCARDPRAGRQQRRNCRADRRPRPDAARCRVCRHGHGRPALHDAAAPLRSRKRL